MILKIYWSANLDTSGSETLLNPSPEPLPVAADRTVMSLSAEAEEKIRSVNDKLVELDPILQSFCEHRGYTLQRVSKLFPSRRAREHGEIDRYLDLMTDAKFVDILKNGFLPEMPWSLYARATPSMWPGRVLTVNVFRGLPFSELAGVLDNGLERGSQFSAL